MRPVLIVLLLSGACTAQPSSMPVTPPTPVQTMPDGAQPSASTSTTAPTVDTSTDDLLDKMERVGVDMKTLRAGVKMKSVDAGTAENSQRNGTIWLQRLPDGDTRGHVRFDDLISGKKKFAQRTEFLLAGDWVVQREYKDQKETDRQVRRPGDKTDLLKLGEGPFPLPIGQPRERVKSQFTVTHLPDDADRPGLAVLELAPLETNKLSQRFQTITVWVDPNDAMPRVVQTVDKNGATINTTVLSDVKINEGVQDADFTLEVIDPKVWEITKVPLDER